MLIDFSFHENVPRTVKLAVECKKAVVGGTTGHGHAAGDGFLRIAN